MEPGAEVPFRPSELLWIQASLVSYVPMGLLSGAWMLRQDAPWLGEQPALGVLIGLSAGFALFGVVRWGQRWRWMADLSETLAVRMGPLRARTCLFLAVASSTAEELLFRGALPLAVGGVWSNLVFALFHLPAEWGLRAWPVLALLAGGLFQLLADRTGGLIAPTLAHGLLNFLVLYYRIGARPR